MSHSVAYCVLIQNGEKRCFEERWATLYRELMWGPDAFAAWLSQGQEIDWNPGELSGVAVVDFDAKRLKWGEEDGLILPRVRAAHHQLLRQAWPGYTIVTLSEREMSVEVDGDSEEDDDDGGERPKSITQAIERFAKGSDDEEPDEDADNFDESWPCAWATIIDQKGKVRQRILDAVPRDVISGDTSAIQRLAKVKPAEVPPEVAVREGFWINLATRDIGFWGDSESRSVFHDLQSGWPGWNVTWADNGYVEQCQISGQPGLPMSDTDALVRFLPHVLSTRKVDMSAIMGAMGGSLKKTAVKGVGCLLVVLSLPIALAGIFMDKLMEAGCAIATLVVIVAVVFKFLESKVKRKFADSPMNRQSDAERARPAVAGELEDGPRRAEIDRLLVGAGFPLLAELEPHFPDGDLDDLW